MNNKLFTSVFAALLIFPWLSLAQVKGDSAISMDQYEVTGKVRKRSLEIFKNQTNRMFRLEEGRDVWVRYLNPKGREKTKRTRLTHIGEHELTFVPYNKKYSEITISDSDLMYIGFTSTGRIVIATISNLVIIAAAVVIYVVVSIVAAFLNGSSTGGGHAFEWVPLVPFKKNISLHDSRQGTRMWELRIVTGGS